MNAERDVSVVIPAYNGADFIGEALESVYAQSCPPAEVVVVDDASTDETPAVVDAAAAAAPLPVRLIRMDRNSGAPAKPLNVGIAAARGPLIAVLDQDDRFEQRKLESQAAILQEDVSLSFAFGQIGTIGKPLALRPLSVRSTPELQAVGRPQNGWYRIAGADAVRLLLTQGTFVGGFPGFVFRKSDWEQRQIDEAFRIAADRDFVAWLSTRGDAAFVPEIHYLRRDHDGNVCRQRLEMHHEDAVVSCRLLRDRRDLRGDPAIDAKLRASLNWLSYAFREEGRYAEAFHCQRLAAAAFGIDGTLVTAMGKLFAHRARRRLYGFFDIFRTDRLGPHRRRSEHAAATSSQQGDPRTP